MILNVLEHAPSLCFPPGLGWFCFVPHSFRRGVSCDYKWLQKESTVSLYGKVGCAPQGALEIDMGGKGID